MIPILFKIGPITLYSYGLMMALGFLAADFVIGRDFGQRGYNPDYASTLVVWAAIGGIAGARILDVFNNLSQYMADPKSIIFSGSGFVWYGGLAGGLIASYGVARRYKIPWLVIADVSGPALALGQGIGRIGCQLAGDGDWGLPSKLPWAMAYPRAIVGWNPQTVLTLDSHGSLVSGFYPGVRVHPAPIYETILYLGVFAVLWSLRKKLHVDGRLFYLYLILAGASRFLVEFIRVNPRVMLGLSEAQLIAIAMMTIGLSAYLVSGIREPKLQIDDARNPVRAQA
ncbi:MAG: prolipoprotein diacylglyceryl transferase [Candidatus Binataceae bacterium]